MNIVDSALVQNEADYRSRHQDRANEIDEFVDYMRQSDDTWGYTRTIMEWGCVTDELLQSACRGAYSHDSIQSAQHILETGLWNDTRIDVDDIYRGIGGWKLDWPHSGADLKNVREAYFRRLFYAHMAIESPDVFETLQQHDIIGLHGTQSIVVPSIIAAGGLLSHASQKERHVLTGSGEAHPMAIRRNFVSFGSIHDSVGPSYADLDLRSKDMKSYLHSGSDLYGGYKLRLDEVDAFNEHIDTIVNAGDTFLEYTNTHRFGVIFGLGRKALWVAGTGEAIGKEIDIASDVDEICFEREVGLDYLPVIFAPEKYKKAVSEAVPASLAVVSREAIMRAQLNAKQSFHGVA